MSYSPAVQGNEQSSAASPGHQTGINNLTFDVVVHPNGHLLDLVVRSGDSDLKACCESDGAKRTVWCDCYVVRFGHGCDTTELGDAAAVCDVYMSSATRSVSTKGIVLTRLYDVDRRIFEEPLEVPSRVQSLSECDRAGRLTVELLYPLWMLA
jgi:hypothetical protein